MIKKIINAIKLVLVILLVFSLNVKSLESSEDYLKNVMVELQGLKSSPSFVQVYPNVHDTHYLAGKRLSGSNSISSIPNAVPAVIYHENVPKIQTIRFTPKKVEPVDMMESASSNQYYQQVPRPIIVPEPSKLDSPLGYTKNELAAMYKQALESGSAINLSVLKNTLDSGQIPSIVDNHLQFPTNQQAAYAYYFYPLKTFINNLQDNYGYKTISDYYPHHSSSVLDSQKQIVINPLFMAISSFVGMALLFMFGVIVLPRIFGEFRSRLVHDELMDLTKTVTEAIDNYSPTVRPKLEHEVVGIRTRPGHRSRRKKPHRSSYVVNTSMGGSL
ncbi:uncharacterized protein [Chelonus insularis]|uniref:uncharacterized protein n=1 Tax=Chelonus insularis TaxID=460826 RepID=UPI00158C2C8A|nr:uncharacterized protein LOC118065724 [Chelonus insularis]